MAAFYDSLTSKIFRPRRPRREAGGDAEANFRRARHFGRFGRKSRQSLAGSLVVVLVWLIFFGGYEQLMAGPGQTLQRHQPGLYLVTAFVDGDTIQIDMNGRTEKIRLVGVDTPETHKPGAPVQCYGPAAAAYTKNLIGQQRVRLGSDPLSTNRDRYQRLLRYVYLPDGRMVNQELIRGGYGFYYPYFPFTKSDEFAALQAEAQAGQRGIWGNCHPTKTDRGGYISNDQGP